MTVKSERKSDLKIIDVDTHLSEPYDLWTSRASSAFQERVPQVREIDGVNVWTFDDQVLGPAVASSVIRKDGTKTTTAAELFTMTVDESHAGASQVRPRLEVMDQLGIWAQIVYPNTIGFGGHRFAAVEDLELRGLAITIWNDAMADLQAESGNRLFPMGLLPWWDVEASVAEVARIKELGLKGVNTNADPQNHGYPDLGHRQWDPLWSAIADAELPLNFHIGASAQQESYFGDTPWESQTDDAKLALGSAMIYLSNARVLGNFIFSGILERHPSLNVVSVESGIGWLPFVMEAMDWQLSETASSAREYLSLKPSEYFKRQIYSCFWFESEQLVPMIEAVGVDRCMFETDFPHPTCLYPKAAAHATEALQGVSDDFREAVLSGNAARVYSISLP